MEPTKVLSIGAIKQFRVAVDALVQSFRDPEAHDTNAPIDGFDSNLYEIAGGQVVISLIGAKMWAGKLLEALGSELPAQFADKADVGGRLPGLGATPPDTLTIAAPQPSQPGIAYAPQGSPASGTAAPATGLAAASIDQAQAAGSALLAPDGNGTPAA